MTIADFTIRDNSFRLNLGIGKVDTSSTDEHVQVAFDAAASMNGKSVQNQIQAEMRGWLLASESALAKGWNNPRDAQYDAL